MRRTLTRVLAAIAALSVPLPALAQDPSCPPGAWFCEEAEPETLPPAPAEQPAPADPPKNTKPPAPVQAPSGGTTVVVPRARAGAPPVVVYQPVPNAPPPQVVIVSPGARPVQPVPPPPPKRPPWKPEWGLNLRLEGVGMGKEQGADRDAGMGGLGLSLRYRPVPAFALDGGLDLIGGIDYNGFERAEVPLSLSALLFVNPRSKVQFYFLGGLHIAHAAVKSDTYSPLLTTAPFDPTFQQSYETEYTYFGGHGGIGLEFRLSKLVALNIDLLGFMRTRTDDGPLPEFYNPETGRTSNTSGGALLRGGLTFWWR